MPIPSVASTAARAAAIAAASSPVSRVRSGLGRISAMTVSFTIIGSDAPERPAPLGMPPISSGARSSSIPAASRTAATDLIVASGRDSYSATASALNSGG
ncbi:hypothetical protein SAMN04487982_11025 [Streptomyces sp. ok210]|nr:hypothetical protein SAMN04487982_11025 [Streptomyces sp. ok210]